MKSSILLLAFIVTGCATTPSPQPESKPVDVRPCAANFSIDGSAVSFAGKSYQSFFKVRGVTQSAAVTKAGKEIALEGLTITTLDKDGGLIAASNQVTLGKDATAPLVVSFEQDKEGVNVTMKFRSGFAQVASADTVKENFCKIASAIEKK